MSTIVSTKYKLLYVHYSYPCIMASSTLISRGAAASAGTPAVQLLAPASSKPKVLAIAGTTSVGKTELSLKLASLLNGEVISADSAQVFRGLDVGSAKVGPEVTGTVKHHLLDVADIDAKEKFNVADFSNMAAKAIEDIISRGRVPLIVGGTGLYMRTLLEGGASGAPQSTEESKAWITRLVETEDQGDWETSLSRLRGLDPVYADSLATNDWYRLKRALEICLISGSTVTSYKKELSAEDYPYDSYCLFLTMPRVELFQRIDTRCETIIQDGLIQEVIGLVKAGRLKLDSQAGRSIGYRQVLEYLQAVWGFPPSQEGEGGSAGGEPYSLKVPREDLMKQFHEFFFVYKSKTRQLAHSQLNWFKKERGFHFQWLNVSPGGSRLPMDTLSEAVAKWFKEGVPLPAEWDGTPLQTLTPAEVQALKCYGYKQSTPQIYAEEKAVNSLMEAIETCLKNS